MITKELIARINALSRKQRSTGLTPTEKQEQKKLRQAYLADIRGQLKGMLDNIEFVDAPQKREPSIIQTGEVSFSLRRTEIKE